MAKAEATVEELVGMIERGKLTILEFLIARGATSSLHTLTNRF